MAQSVRFVLSSTSGVSLLRRCISLPRGLVSPSRLLSYTLNRQNRDPMQSGQVEKHFQKLNNYIKRGHEIHLSSLERTLQLVARENLLLSAQQLRLILWIMDSYLKKISPKTKASFTDLAWKLRDSNRLEIDTFNTFLKLKPDLLEPTEIFRLLKESNLTPNNATYNILIEKCLQKGCIQHANNYLSSAIESKIPLSISTFHSVINKHIQNKDYKSALTEVENLKSLKLVPTSETHTLATACFCALGDYEKALESMNNQSFSDAQLIRIAGETKSREFLSSLIDRLSFEESIESSFDSTCASLLNRNELDHIIVLINELSKAFSSKRSSPHNLVGVLLFKMAKRNSSFEEIVSLYNLLKHHGYETHPLLAAGKYMVTKADRKKAFQVIEFLFQEGVSLTYPSFEKLISRTSNKKELLEVLELMSSIKSQPTIEFVNDFVLSKFGCSDPVGVFDELKPYFDEAVLTNAIIMNLCYNGEFKKCLDFVEDHPATTDIIDVDKVVKMISLKNLKYALKVYAEIQADLTVMPDVDKLIFALPTSYLEEAMDILLSEKIHVRLDVLKEVERKGVRIETFLAHQRLEEFTENRNAFGKDFKVFEEMLHHARMKNFEEAEKILYSSSDVPLHVLVNIARHFGYGNRPESTLECLNRLWPNKNFKPTFEFAFRVANSLISFKHLPEARRLLLEYDLFINFDTKDTRIRLQKVLRCVTVNYGTDEAVKLLNEILARHNLKFHLDFCAPIIKSHLYQSTWQKGIDFFKYFIQKHDITPLSSEIYGILLQHGENEQLKEVFSLHSRSVGYMRATKYLANAYIRNGRKEEAIQALSKVDDQEKLLELLEFWAENFVTHKQIDCLEMLIEISEEMTQTTPPELYNALIRAYGAANDSDKLLELWLLFQEKGMFLSNGMLRLIKTVLERNNRPVPFYVKN